MRGHSTCVCVCDGAVGVCVCLFVGRHARVMEMCVCVLQEQRYHVAIKIITAGGDNAFGRASAHG